MAGKSIIGALVAALLLSACTPADVPDCERDDRRKHETPDCGWVSKSGYREWSWVKAGRTTPPPGWSAAKEKKAATSPAKPKKVKR